MDLKGSRDVFLGKCNAKGTYSLHWLIKTAETLTDVRAIQSNILMLTEAGNALSVDAELETWNADFIAVSAKNNPVILEMLKAAADAKKAISVGYILHDIDSKESGSLTARGSTATINKFFKHCEIQ